MTFTAGGVGEVNTKNLNEGHPAWTEAVPMRQGGHWIHGGRTGVSINLQPYYKVDYSIAAYNDTEPTSGSPSGPTFDGKLSARVKSDFGDFQAVFPPDYADDYGTRNDDRRRNEISIPDGNVIHRTTGEGGRLLMAAAFTFGLKVDLGIFGDLFSRQYALPDVSAGETHIMGNSKWWAPEQ